jgi:hypothetical protein
VATCFCVIFTNIAIRPLLSRAFTRRRKPVRIAEIIRSVRVVLFQMWARKSFISCIIFVVLLRPPEKFCSTALKWHAARSRAVASHFVAFRNNYVLRCGAISRKIKPLQGSGRPMGCFSIWILPLTCPAREALPVASYGQYSLADLLFTCISISISEAFQAMKLRKHSQIN